MSSAEAYADFAESEVKGYSPTYYEWANAISQDNDVLELIDQLEPRCRQPNLVFAACRYLGIEAGPYAKFRKFLLANWLEVVSIAHTRRTQTNEPGRCAVLLPLLASLPQPLALLEVGASAGLCLYPDRYSYVYDSEHRIDPVEGPSQVSISCTTLGCPPLPDSLPEVVWRAGIDLNPLDVCDAPSMKWLEALVWPEQDFRLSRLRGAIAIAKSDPPLLFNGDLVERLGEVAAMAPRDASLVVFHSAVLAYLAEDQRRAFVEQVNSLGATWISNEGIGVVVPRELVIAVAHDNNPTPFVLARDGVAVAYAGAHGQTLEWM